MSYYEMSFYKMSQRQIYRVSRIILDRINGLYYNLGDK